MMVLLMLGSNVHTASLFLMLNAKERGWYCFSSARDASTWLLRFAVVDVVGVLKSLILLSNHRIHLNDRGWKRSSLLIVAGLDRKHSLAHRQTSFHRLL